MEENIKSEIVEGSVVKSKKKHPCGADSWLVERLGIDVKLKCTGCGREIEIKRQLFAKNFKKTK